MKSAPAVQDVSPQNLSLWDAGTGLDGTYFRLPVHSVVTSRLGRPDSRRRNHFALVCKKESAILSDDDVAYEDIDLNHVRNLRSGAIVGSSQVTSIVRREADGTDQTGRYPVRFTATLVPPYFVTLTDGISVPADQSHEGVDELRESFDSFLAMRRTHFGQELATDTLASL
jgi:hypothetical protein